MMPETEDGPAATAFAAVVMGILFGIVAASAGAVLFVMGLVVAGYNPVFGSDSGGLREILGAVISYAGLAAVAVSPVVFVWTAWRQWNS